MFLVFPSYDRTIVVLDYASITVFCGEYIVSLATTRSQNPNIELHGGATELERTR